MLSMYGDVICVPIFYSEIRGKTFRKNTKSDNEKVPNLISLFRINPGIMCMLQTLTNLLFTDLTNTNQYINQL
jgi:hypothetical protein